jgi:hypothetical protein
MHNAFRLHARRNCSTKWMMHARIGVILGEREGHASLNSRLFISKAGLSMELKWNK